MTTDIEKIIKDAQKYKACAKVLEIDSMENAVKVLFTPQGREFAINTGYPTIETFRENKTNLEGMRCIYIDSGHKLADDHNIIAVGKSDITAYASGTEALYHIMAMHGATVKIDARNYAVITATSIGGNIEYTNDGTAIISIEKK